jgi:hypothetical protein
MGSRQRGIQLNDRIRLDESLFDLVVDVFSDPLVTE